MVLDGHTQKKRPGPQILDLVRRLAALMEAMQELAISMNERLHLDILDRNILSSLFWGSQKVVPKSSDPPAASSNLRSGWHRWFYECSARATGSCRIFSIH